MKKRSFIFSALSAMTLAGIMLGVACRKDNQVGKDHAGVAGTLADCGCTVATSDSTISAGALNVNLTLSATKRYTLAGLVFVTGNHTLTIQAGTTILGAKGSTTDPNNPGGGLIITKGSKINAVGTASCPIIFTSAVADPNKASGDWAGVILLGKATTNQPTTTTVEGINASNTPAGVDATFGGTDDNDNSGTLKFVRIEYAGHSLSLNNEINALTMAGVGRGTTIDFVEAFKSFDDSFEWFGGTVNASHLASIAALDDMFDTDNGYRGTIRFALGVSDTTRADQSQSNGFESDNEADGVNNTPHTHPVYRYVTIVGVPNTTKAHITNFGPGGTTGSYGRAAHLRRNAEFDIDSSIFQGFKWGWSLDTTLPASPTRPNTWTKYFLTPVSSFTFKNFVHAYEAAFPYIVEGLPAGTNTAWTPKAADMDVSATGTSFFLPNAWLGTGVSNFFPTALNVQPYGAFPNRVDWTTGGATCSNWFKLK